jgi:hypothetical protein
MSSEQFSAPVVIVSTGRAGSMMLAQTLASHPDLLAFHEPKPHLNVESFRAWENSIHTEKLHNRIEKKRSSLIEQASWNRNTYVESSHYASHLIQELYELYEARFVHLHRDGRAFVRSGLELDYWYPESYADVFKRSFLGGVWEHEVLNRIRRRGLLDVGFSWNDHRLDPPDNLESRVEKVSWLWNEINRSVLDQLATVPADSFSISLDDFSRDVLQKLLDFLEVSSSPTLLDTMLDIANRKPNRTKKRSVAAFSEWNAEDQEAFWSVAKPMMERLGYKHED